MSSKSDSSAMRAAIAETVATIEKRTRLYRNLVVCVCALIFGCLAVAVIMRSLVPIAGVVLVVPMVATYLQLDSRQVKLWRDGVLKASQGGDLDLGMFVKSIKGYSFLPRHTTRAMIDSLPNGETGGKLTD